MYSICLPTNTHGFSMWGAQLACTRSGSSVQSAGRQTVIWDGTPSKIICVHLERVHRSFLSNLNIPHFHCRLATAQRKVDNRPRSKLRVVRAESQSSLGLHQLVPHGVNGEMQVQRFLHDRVELRCPHLQLTGQTHKLYLLWRWQRPVVANCAISYFFSLYLILHVCVQTFNGIGCKLSEEELNKALLRR